MKQSIKFSVTLSVLFVLCNLITPKLFAQTPTNGIFFQAVARDNFSNPAKDRKIYVQSSIIQSAATGTKVLTEEYQTTTDATGVFSISIGQGTRIGGTMNNLTSIDWSKGPYFLNLKVAISPVAPTTSWDYKSEWIDLGTTSFGTVPYALYAGTAAGVDQKVNISDTVKMLTPYAKVSAVKILETGLATKLTATDTSTMLANYAKTIQTIDTAYLKSQLVTKVDKISGKDLSTNDYTTTEKTKLAAILGTNTGDQTTITGNAGTVTNGVYTVGDQTIAGAKTFSSTIVGSVSGNAATVTTNANLTGPVTSVGNATAIANGAITNAMLANGAVANLSGTNTGDQTTITGNAGTVTNGVYTVGDQTIAGTKTFNKDIVVNSVMIGKGGNTLADNIAIGNGARSGNINTGGNANIAIGTDAQKNNTGFYNVSVGNANLVNGSGDENTALGYTVMANNTSGMRNTGVGLFSFYQNTTGNYNTAIGHGSLGVNTTGSYNTALGTSADVATNNLTNATAIGYGASVDASNSIQLGNTSVTNVKTSGTFTADAVTYPKTHGTNGQVLSTTGSGTLAWITPSTTATAYSGTLPIANGGTGSATKNFVDLTTGQYIDGAKTFNQNILVNYGTDGTQAVRIGTQGGNYNTMFGAATFLYGTPGSNNTAIGGFALASLNGGNENTAVGLNAIRQGGAADGSRNTAVGVAALSNGSGTNDNTAIGTYTLAGSITGGSNVAVGNYSLQNNTSANYNVGVGYESLKNTTTGGNNTAIGHGSMLSNTSGDVNTAVGENSLISNTIGRYNTAIGVQAQEQNTTGAQNTAIGVAAIDRNTAGNYNAVLGAFSGRYIADNTTFNTAINNSVLVGALSRPLANNANNEIVIGYDAIGNGSNTVTLGNTSITNVKTSGTITAGAVTYPKVDGTNGQVLTTNGSGTTSWQSKSAVSHSKKTDATTASVITVGDLKFRFNTSTGSVEVLSLSGFKNVQVFATKKTYTSNTSGGGGTTLNYFVNENYFGTWSPIVRLDSYTTLLTINYYETIDFHIHNIGNGSNPVMPNESYKVFVANDGYDMILLRVDFAN